MVWIKHHFAYAPKIRFPLILKIFLLQNKIHTPLNVTSIFFYQILTNQYTQACWSMQVGISEMWILQGWKHPGMSWDVFYQQKTWECFRQFSGECQELTSCQSALGAFKGWWLNTASCVVPVGCPGRAERVSWFVKMSQKAKRRHKHLLYNPMINKK